MKQDLKSMTLAEMQAAFQELGEPAFRAKQVFVWLHRGAASFDEMTNLSKPLRQRLDGLYDITAPEIVRKLQSQKDGTIKYLWKLRDGNCVESVLMQYHHGNSICISSEVGCPMGCKFCASTLGGLVRRMSGRQKKEIVVKVERMAPNQSTVQCAPPMPETPFIIPEPKTEIRAKKPERRSSRQEKGQAVKQPVPKMEIPNILKELETGGCA